MSVSTQMSGNKPDTEASPSSIAISEPEVAIVRFRVKECYLYSIPPAGTLGHRAEMWDVNKWLQELALQVVSVGDRCFVRMFDQESGEAFAECPLPLNPANFHTVVEPVVDSSRYFVLRIEDPESGRHAFIGIGFRDRAEASDFNAALDDHRAFLRRQREAEQIAHEREEAEQQAPGAASGPAKDMTIKGTIHVEMKNLGLGKKASAKGGGFLDRMQSLSAVEPPKGGGLFLPPPPEAAAIKAPPPTAAPSQQPTGGASPGGFWRAFDNGDASSPAAEVSGKGGKTMSCSPPRTPDAVAPDGALDTEAGDDDWGDFQG